MTSTMTKVYEARWVPGDGVTPPRPYYDLYYAGTEDHRDSFESMEAVLEHVEALGGKLRTYISVPCDTWMDETPQEYRQRCEEFRNDPLCQMFQATITEEINKEILKTIKGSK